MKELFNTRFGTIPFAEQWLIDEDVIKADANAKPLRAFHKTLILAMQYGQTANGMSKYAFDRGYSLSLPHAQKFHTAFWYQLFPDVRRLGERLYDIVDRTGYLVNDFGFRMVPERPDLALNYLIQSSVSGIMNVLAAKFFTICPEAEYLGTIHDEIVGECKADRVEHVKSKFYEAVDSLNIDLGWKIAIRCGFVTGRNWYEAK